MLKIVIRFIFFISVLFLYPTFVFCTVGVPAVDFYYGGKANQIKGRAVSNFEFIFNTGAAKKVKIVTLDWAPYIGRNICRQGWVQQFTVALLVSQGYEVHCGFYPWARAVFLAESGEADILYPEYFIEPDAPSDVFKGTKRLDHLILSERFPGGAIAFMKRNGYQDRYKGNLLNLKEESIGVVRGYQNTPEFDRLMDKKYFNISQSVDDVMNARKLVQNRTNLIIGDPAVILFSVAHREKISLKERDKIVNTITTVKPLIKYNHLYFALSKKRPHWQQLLYTLNQAIAEFEGSGELFRIIRRTNAECGFRMRTLAPFEAP